jgi:hypothetical protein
MNKLASIIIVMLLSFSAHARNPGESAQNCVSANNGGNGKVIFSNGCGVPVFVIYCGDLKYSNKKCGDSGRFYNMSVNIVAGGQTGADINGTYQWAACKGSIGFGHDEFEDYPNGSFRCLPR